ncbi:UNVERIFIED_ORG: AraC-like DNA-binding protein [Rhizobium etli]
MKAALQNYHARMQRVLDHIDRHLDDDLDLYALSNVAAYSKYHFHRQFTATFGLSVHRYIQLARMKRASYQLAYRDAQSVTDIAMEAGYDGPDALPALFGNGSGNRLRLSGSLPTGSRGLWPLGLSTTPGASSCRRLLPLTT